MPRKPIPTNLKLLRGNPGKRPITKDEPRIAVEIPRPPLHMTKDEKKIFRKIAKQLAAARVITQLDSNALMLYCTAYVRWVQANKMIEQDGYLIDSPNGYAMPSPWLSISNKSFEQMRQIMTEFGMTPSSRTKVTVLPEQKKQSDPWSGF